MALVGQRQNPAGPMVKAPMWWLATCTARLQYIPYYSHLGEALYL